MTNAILTNAILKAEAPEVSQLYDELFPSAAQVLWEGFQGDEPDLTDFAMVTAEIFGKAALVDLAEVQDAATEWARDTAGRLAKHLSGEQEQAVKRIVARGVQHGLSNDEVAAALVKKVGLTPAYAEAVENYRLGLIAKGESPGNARRMASQYADRLRHHRAVTIASTEVQAALNMGQQRVWEELAKQGELPVGTKRKWVVHRDDRLCKFCKGMGGKLVKVVGGEYRTKLGVFKAPPLHPSCRCSETLVAPSGRVVKVQLSVLPWHNVNTRTAIDGQGQSAPQRMLEVDGNHPSANWVSKARRTSSTSSDVRTEEGADSSRGASRSLRLRLSDLCEPGSFGTGNASGEQSSDGRQGKNGQPKEDALQARTQVHAGEHSGGQTGQWEDLATMPPVSPGGHARQEGTGEETTCRATEVGGVEKHGDPSDPGYFLLHPNSRKRRVPGVKYHTSKPDPRRSGAKRAERGSAAKQMHPITAQDKLWLSKQKIRVPPAWTDVQISDDRNARLIATGKDSKGRTQPLYSSAHTEAQAAAKFQRVEKLQQQIGKLDTALEKEAMEYPAAAVLLLLRRMGMRIGSERDTKAEKKAYGASNLQARHVTINQQSVTLSFVGKKGVVVRLNTKDPLVMDVVEAYYNETETGTDQLFGVTPEEVTKYLHYYLPDFKLKDLRTLYANGIAYSLVERQGSRKPKSATELKRMKREVVVEVAQYLGNTPAVALSSYINPAVFFPWTVENESFAKWEI